MIRFLDRNLHHIGRLNRTHLDSLYSSIPKTVHKSEDPPNPKTSLTVSFLTNSCGLTLSAALSIAKKFCIKSHEKPNAVLTLLKDHNFTDTQIAQMITKIPRLLHINPDTVIKPKLEFFLGVGYSAPDLTKLISPNPRLLFHSLDKKLRHNFALLQSFLGPAALDSIKTLEKMSCLLQSNFEKYLQQNVKILQEHGFPSSNIVKLATMHPRVLARSSVQLRKAVEVVKELGLEPTSTMSLHAIYAICALSPLKWERKLALYKSLGWSEEETISAFVKNPSCMTRSEEKIRKSMDFCVKELHLEPSYVSAFPMLLSFSLEKRIVPRCAVMNLLSSRGLIGRKVSVRTFLAIGDRGFLEKYVMKHLDNVPEIIEVYRGKKDFSGLDERK